MLLPSVFWFSVLSVTLFPLNAESEQGLKCSQIAMQAQKHSCGQVNKAVCEGLGCCWNESEANLTIQCFSISTSSTQNVTRNYCSHYEGQICRDVFSTTSPSLSSLPRLHSVRQNEIESALRSAVSSIEENVTHSECKSALITMLCHYTMPPCHANYSVTQFCATECHNVFSKCGPFIQQLDASSVLPSGTEFSFPRCSELNSASETDEASNIACTKLGLDVSTSGKPKPAVNDALNSAMQPNCSTITAKEKVGCVINTNATVCVSMGCCWNPSETNKTLRCYTKKGGSCKPYRGKVCRHSLNSTLPTYRLTPRFFDNKFGLPGTEQFLLTVTKVINEFVKDDKKCRYILLNMLCQYTLQPCYTDDPNNKVIEYCKEDCEAIFDECSGSLNQVIGGVKVFIKNQGIDFVHTGLPDCSKHRPESYFEDKSDEICIKTGFFNYKATPPGDHKLEIIIPLVVVGLLLIMVLVTVFVLWKRRQKQRDAVDNAYAITKKGTITMRDRLRAESLKSLDSRLLRLYDPNKLKQYRLDHVQYVKDLGEGFFGKVFQGRATGLLDNQPKKEVAVAVKALKDEPSNEQKDEFFREVTLMSILAHPNIVKLLAVSTEEEPYGMVFEFMSKGDLNQYLRSALPAETSLQSEETAKVYLSQEDLVAISVQIAAGMQYLAEMKFVHRDLAARNCLVGDDLVVKIGDFGMSRDIYSSEYYKMSKETLLPIRWLAPEAFLYGKFSLKSDVYAYGVVLWEIFTFGLQPYYGYTNREVMDFIQKGIHLGKPDNCPDFIYAIMKDCWIQEPEKRIEFTAVSMRLKDPFHNYDVPPSSDSEDGPERAETKEPDMGNYDIPRSNAASNYDIPRASANEGTYDVPRSYEDLTDEKFNEGGTIPVADSPV